MLISVFCRLFSTSEPKTEIEDKLQILQMSEAKAFRG